MLIILQIHFPVNTCPLFEGVLYFIAIVFTAVLDIATLNNGDNINY